MADAERNLVAKQTFLNMVKNVESC